MAVIMAESLKRKLEKVSTRKCWTVAELVKILGCSKRCVYRRIENKYFTTMDDGEFKMKVLSSSIVKFYNTRFVKKPQRKPSGKDDFIMGFYAGLKVRETAQKLDINLGNLSLILADYCKGVYDDCNHE